MIEKREKKKKFDGEEVEVLGETYEEGIPEDADRWRGKMRSREEMLRYIETGLRYYYGESYGTEKRRTPA